MALQFNYYGHKQKIMSDKFNIEDYKVKYWQNIKRFRCKSNKTFYICQYFEIYNTVAFIDLCNNGPVHDTHMKQGHITLLMNVV